MKRRAFNKRFDGYVKELMESQDSTQSTVASLIAKIDGVTQETVTVTLATLAILRVEVNSINNKADALRSAQSIAELVRSTLVDNLDVYYKDWNN